MEKDSNVGSKSFLETLNTAYAFIWKVMSDYCIIYKEKGPVDKSCIAFIHFFNITEKKKKTSNVELGQRCTILALLMLVQK